jgi:hypothetical protein
MNPPKTSGRDFTHLALWMAATLAGVVTAALLARGPFFRALSRRVGWAKRSADALRGRSRGSKRPTRQESLPLLADAVLGNSKCAVASVFGPPRGAILEGEVNKHSNYWQADTWYYPLPGNGPLAMVIRFDEDFAEKVEFLSPPGR